MRQNIIRIGLVVLLILIGFFFFHMGKQHKIYLDNRDFTIDEITFKASSDLQIFVDGDEIGVIKKGKRKVVYVAGSNHDIRMVKKDNSEVVEEYNRDFKMTLKEEVMIINIPALLEDSSYWMREKK